MLAAGFGTRLRPITDKIPKCLVPINGKPLLGIWLNKLASEGFGPYLVNTHYLADKVAEFIDKNPIKSSVTLVYEPILKGTAGTLIANVQFYKGSDGLLIHADNYCMSDLSLLVLAHRKRPSGCVMTMLTFRAASPETCGILEVDSQGVLVGFHEKVDNPPGNLANGAIYIISNRMMQELVEKLPDMRDFSTEVIPRFLHRIYTYESNKPVIDIGTPQAYASVNK